MSPARVVRGILVQLEKGYSDRELEEESAYDDRVKLALGLRRSDPPLDASTLCRHRHKLFLSGKAEELLKKVVMLGKAEGVISEEVSLVVDSFLMRGACASEARHSNADKARSSQGAEDRRVPWDSVGSEAPEGRLCSEEEAIHQLA